MDTYQPGEVKGVLDSWHDQIAYELELIMRGTLKTPSEERAAILFRKFLILVAVVRRQEEALENIRFESANHSDDLISSAWLVNTTNKALADAEKILVGVR